MAQIRGENEYKSPYIAFQFMGTSHQVFQTPSTLRPHVPDDRWRDDPHVSLLLVRSRAVTPPRRAEAFRLMRTCLDAVGGKLTFTLHASQLQFLSGGFWPITTANINRYTRDLAKKTRKRIPVLAWSLPESPERDVIAQCAAAVKSLFPQEDTKQVYREGMPFQPHVTRMFPGPEDLEELRALAKDRDGGEEEAMLVLDEVVVQ